MNVFAHLNSHSGTENIVSLVQNTPNMIQKKNNVITVQKDSSEMLSATPVSQDSD